MARIVAIDDSVDVQRLLTRALSHHRVSVAGCLADGRAEIERAQPDLVLLDRDLPDGDGLDLFRKLREDTRFEKLPVLFLTACNAIEDKVSAFSLGADDYIEKPFEAAELVARVEARLRRSAGDGATLLRFGALELDPVQLTLRWPGAAEGRNDELQLTPIEFRILHALVREVGQPVPRVRLTRAVWGDVLVSERTLDTHVSNLRRKLGDEGEALRAVRGVGYRFDLDAA